MPTFLIPKAGKIRVGRDGLNVILDGDTKVIPWQAALDLARAIFARAKEIEQDVNAGRIIDDQAILMRLGIHLGLTNNQAILSEARKESMYNPKLRKYITGGRVKGIESAEKLGTPSLIQHKPKEGGNHNV